MSDVRRHYDELLGAVYTWILGDFEPACAKSDAVFERLGLGPGATGVAVDLGAGPGCQSVPLARRGYSVTAIDFCEPLLAELGARAGDLPVRTVAADIRSCRDIVEEADLVVCMGDTLVHLPDRRAARTALAAMAQTVVEGGSVVVSIRDYDRPGPEGAARFVPIRSSPDRIFTCFLEYRDDTVLVSDILQRRSGDGWTLEISSYVKLRLSMDWVADVLDAEGLTVADRFEQDGMLCLRALR